MATSTHEEKTIGKKRRNHSVEFDVHSNQITQWKSQYLDNASELFSKGKANLGLTPKQHSSGGKGRLLEMSKRGDTYLQTLLIQSARSALKVIDEKTDPRRQRLQNLCGRRHKNVAAVALANKNTRIAWALLNNDTNYLSEGKPT